MKVAVIANGNWNPAWGIRELADCDLLIAADGGGNHALRAGRLPQVLIGDLDSITPENLETCRQAGTLLEQYPREKDETDLELALDYTIQYLKNKGLDQNVIWLYGGTGGRVDHLMGNIALLLKYKKVGTTIRIKDPLHDIWLVSGCEAIKGHQGQVLSIIPIAEEATVRTEGLQYPLADEILRLDSSRGISNVFLGEDALIEVSHGIVMVVLISIDAKQYM